MLDIARPPSAAAGPIRILFVGHAAIPTGFARVIHSLLRELPERFDLHHLAINLESRPAPNPGWTVHLNSGGLHSAVRLAEVIAQVLPSIVVVVDEPWVCHRLAPALLDQTGFCSVFYGAADGEASAGPLVAAMLARLDCFVSFTRFGHDIVCDAIARQGLRAPRQEIIPHGVDTGLFHPLAEGPQDGFRASRKLAREALFPALGQPDEAFIVLNANRNQPFKRIDVFLRGFALFAADKPPHVKVYLHMASRTPKPGEVPLADALGIRHRILSGASPQHPEVPSAWLNQLYCACDVGVNTSEKEGWGLVSFEHAAAGGAQIVPRHTACAELWDGGTGLFFDGGPEGVAQALEILYRDPARRDAIAAAGYHHARRPEFSWKVIGARWADLFDRLLTQSGEPPGNSV